MRLYKILLLLSLLFLAAIAIIMHSRFIDDAYIGFQVVKNALLGNGWVFNACERVEAVTNIGWLLILYPLSILFPVTLIAKILNTICILATIIILFKILKSLTNNNWASWFTLLVVINFDYIFFSLGGMETAFLSLLLSILVLIVCKEKNTYIIPIILAYAFFVRPETIVIYPITIVILLTLNRALWKKHLLQFLLFIILISFGQVMRYLYYGNWLPNTFLSKPGQSLAHILEKIGRYGFHLPNISTPFSEILLVLLVIIGILSIPKKFIYLKALSVAITTCAYLFALYAPTDWTRTGRYFAPYVPFMTMLAVLGFFYIYKNLVKNLESVFQSNIHLISGAVLSLYIIIASLSFLGYFNKINLETYPNFVMTSKNLTEPAKWIKENTSSDAVIATRRIGALAYYSDRYIFDFTYGLPNRDVASIIHKTKRPHDSPNATALKEIWTETSPDYILEDTQKILPLLVKPDTLYVQGEVFTILKKFRLNSSTDWILCQKVSE